MAFNFEDLLKEEVTFENGMQGKKIMVYGVNDTGKTKQLTKLDKPFLIMTESGGSAVNCPKTPCTSWKDFNEIVKDMTAKATFDKRYELCHTIIIDTAENLVAQSEKAVCAQFGVRDLSEIQGRQNGYKIARTDFEMQISKLTSAGYCVVFIAHEEKVMMTDEITQEEYEFVQPKGTSNEKSSMRMLRDLCDYCIYLRPNGIDKETFETIPSTAICRRTKNVFARSRFNIQTFIEPFTAQGLIEAVEESVKKSAEEEGVQISEYKNRRKEYTKEDYFEIIAPYASKLYEVCGDEVLSIIESELGDNVLDYRNATDDQLVALENIYNKFVTKATLLGLDI